VMHRCMNKPRQAIPVAPMLRATSSKLWYTASKCTCGTSRGCCTECSKAKAIGWMYISTYHRFNDYCALLTQKLWQKQALLLLCISKRALRSQLHLVCWLHTWVHCHDHISR
jgi:hypothetical protein